MSYARAGWKNGKLVKSDEFWNTVAGNFLDTAVTEWCKLFADTSGKHRWSKVVSNSPAFEAALLAHSGVSSADFQDYIHEMRTYRDKFVAHLDDLEQMQIPKLDLAKGSLTFLYDHMIQNEDPGGWFHDMPECAKNYLEQCDAEGKEVYK
ncbi:MAG: hypothetical protein Q8K31_07100 [Burkholderiaceae bacterium]|nr:hypothetical protein [Burkholderiaceae bacterium]